MTQSPFPRQVYYVQTLFSRVLGLMVRLISVTVSHLMRRLDPVLDVFGRDGVGGVSPRPRAAVER